MPKLVHERFDEYMKRTFTSREMLEMYVFTNNDKVKERVGVALNNYPFN